MDWKSISCVESSVKKKYFFPEDFETLFEGKAWYVAELARKVGVPPHIMRNWLRTLWVNRRLKRVKNGRYLIYFTVKDFETYERRMRNERRLRNTSKTEKVG